MSSSNSERFLEMARNIGNKLCQKAFWHNSRCNWIERSIDDMLQSGLMANKALSSEIYEGTSGIALFLSNLYAFDNKKDYKYKRTAEAAIGQALSIARDITMETRFGFYSGQMGIAYVAAVAGRNLSNPTLIEEALKIVHQLYKYRSPPYNLLDMISGIAGAIPSLIKIHEISGDSLALEMATELGDGLLVSATKESCGWSWSYKGSGLQSAIHNLTGFSHGAAGMGYALMGLYAMIQDEKYAEGAKAAFQYENHWFDSKNDNWPDFRIDERNANDLQKREMMEVPKFASGWCHGAPGISISRLMAFQILKDERYSYSDDIESSVRNMSRIAAGIHTSTDYPNFSLCHGLSGIGDILICARDILKNDPLISLALRIGSYGIERFVEKNLPWPCDNRVGELPGLMLGIAGIGNFYLRLSHPSSKHIPTPLMPVI